MFSRLDRFGPLSIRHGVVYLGKKGDGEDRGLPRARGRRHHESDGAAGAREGGIRQAENTETTYQASTSVICDPTRSLSTKLLSQDSRSVLMGRMSYCIERGSWPNVAFQG